MRATAWNRGLIYFFEVSADLLPVHEKPDCPHFEISSALLRFILRMRAQARPGFIDGADLHVHEPMESATGG